MNRLRDAMQIVDSDDRATMAVEAVGRALTEVHDHAPPEDDALARREAAEQERQAREDAATADATEIVMRARSRVGRTRWSATEGRVIRQIVEALRSLPGEEI